MKEIRDLVEQGVSSQTIVKGLRRASAMAVNKVKEIAVSMVDAAGNEKEKVEILRKLAGTAMNSKLIKRNADFFTKSKIMFPSLILHVGPLETNHAGNSGCGCCSLT